MASVDMTRGGISSTLLRFTVPLVLSGLLQQLYTVTDALILGRGPGEAALAAAGCAQPLFNILLLLVTAASTGCTVLVAHAAGAKDTDRVVRITVTTALCLTAAAAALAVPGMLFSRRALGLLNAAPVLLPDASAYLSILLAGLPFLFFYNLSGAVLRGMGDSRTPLLALLVSAGLNIVLDWIAVFPLGLGVRGAAAATVAAEICSAGFIGVVLFSRLRAMGFSGPVSGWFSPDALLAVLRLSAPAMVQAGLTAGGRLLLQNVVNAFGVTVVAGISTAYKVDELLILPVGSAATALTTFTAQNLGAGDRARVRGGFFRGLAWVCAFAGASTVLLLCFGRQLLGLFNVSAQTAAIGYRLFFLHGPFYLVLGLSDAVGAYLRAHKDMGFVAAGAVAALALRVAVCYLFRGALGSDVISWAEICMWCTTAALYTLRARRFLRADKEHCPETAAPRP